MRRLQVINDLGKSALLSGSGMEGENRLETLPNLAVGLKLNTISRTQVISAKRQSQLEEEELLKNKPSVIGRSPPVEQVDIIVESGLV